MAAVGEPPDRERPEAPRVAHGDHVVGGEQHQRERALPRRQGALDAFLPGLPAGGGEHQGHHLGVAGGGEAESAIQQFVAQRRCIDQVAVVGQGQRAVHRLDEERLDVAFGVRAGRRVPGVADGVVAGQRCERLGGEHVGDEAGLFVDPGPLAVADGDTGGLLAAVLEREQPEERQLGDAFAVRGRQPSTPHSSFGVSSPRSVAAPDGAGSASGVQAIGVPMSVDVQSRQRGVDSWWCRVGARYERDAREAFEGVDVAPCRCAPRRRRATRGLGPSPV